MCISCVLCQPFWFSRPIDTPLLISTATTQMSEWRKERKRAGRKMRVKRGEKKVNEETGGCDRFEVFEGDKDVEAWRGLCLHDIVCVWLGGVHAHTNEIMCMCCSPSVYLSLFPNQIVTETMHLIVFPHRCEAAASFMYSIYPCVTSSGLHLLTDCVLQEPLIKWFWGIMGAAHHEGLQNLQCSSFKVVAPNLRTPARGL